MRFDSNLLLSIIRENYNINVAIVQLGGDADYNFQLIDEQDKRYLLKICKPDVSVDEVEFQVSLLQYVQQQQLNFSTPIVIPTISGDNFFVCQIENTSFTFRLHSWVEGRMIADINPRSSELFYNWGETCGGLSLALQNFDHPGAHRFDKWDPLESLHSKQYLSFIATDERKGIAEYFWNLFEDNVMPVKSTLRKSVNYSDAHEHNLLVNEAKINTQVSGVIDFGDAIYSATICELAIACAYVGMYMNDPISAMASTIKGYHSKFPILEEELIILFPLICGRLMITAANAAQKSHEEPENKYHQISEKPAWDLLLKLQAIHPNLAHYNFRAACDLEPVPNSPDIQNWLFENQDKICQPIDLTSTTTMKMDLSVGSLDLGGNLNFETIPRFSNRINQILASQNAKVGIGGYGEIRPFYTTDAYQIEGNNGPEWRTMHLGTDYWTQAEYPVQAFYSGEVFSIKNNDNACDYGPTIIIKHKIENGQSFYSLYGHLSLASLTHVSVGQKVEKGDHIGWVGDGKVNGGWPPHLHFQVILDLLGIDGDFPGVSFVEKSKIWLSLCPTISKSDKDSLVNSVSEIHEILSQRNNSLGKSLSISYKEPLHIVRGYGIYLYDSMGRRYMDTVNNVAHVGHEHPRIVKAASRQMEMLNTNTRYLHKNIVAYAEALLANCPDELEVVYLVNSGSEANELALRMAKVYSGQKDIIAIESGYHGNTGACIDISSYKFDGKGGNGVPEHTSICRLPDTYRGRFRDESTAGKQYAEDVKKAIVNIQSKGRNVAGFIAESILSCGGQIVLPPDYLKESYEHVRANGGLCISDEVQVGFGRVGDHFWGFELQDVVPDIITCGKPIGNGHPLAAVITTKKVADTFNNGMEFFNTFGGNPVSCAIGKEVLSIIKDENLQHNAKQIGDFLLQELSTLKSKYPIIGDVRGEGLFLGFELVKNRKTLEPAAAQATYLVNRMRTNGVLMSTDGPLHNVIKIKPPMCITIANAREVISRLDKVMREDFMQIAKH